MDDPFYQEVEVQFPLNRVVSAGKVNRLLKSAGATLFYDVYGFKRETEVPDWQSECFADVYLYFQGQSADAQESIDHVVLRYPMASIGTEYIEKFCSLAQEISVAFDVTAELDGEVIDSDLLRAYLESIAARIMEDWGEEPGSMGLAILIETN